MTAFVVPFSTTYYPVLCWRGLSGALVISSLPIYLSILGDSFPPSRRSTASVISSIVVGFGMLAGQTLSGFLSARFGWRFFFKLVPVLGLFTLLFLSRSLSPPHSRAEVTLPRRGEADGIAKPTSQPFTTSSSQPLAKPASQPLAKPTSQSLVASARDVLSSLRVRSNLLRRSARHPHPQCSCRACPAPCPGASTAATCTTCSPTRSTSPRTPWVCRATLILRPPRSSSSSAPAPRLATRPPACSAA